MNQPTPAIVAQSAVRRLPRPALLLFCVAYVLAGFIGREPWKSADIAAFGYMADLAEGVSNWLNPTLLGQRPDIDALLPYWLGAWSIKLMPVWVAPDFAARIPFAILLALSLVATWYGTYYVSRSPLAQPVAFAFGGEAEPTDYARAMADGGLLALIACLGLAQLSHETTPAQAQLCFTALAFYGAAAIPYRTIGPAIGLVTGLLGLSLSGAPAMSLWFGAGIAVICLLDSKPDASSASRRLYWAAGIALICVVAAALAWSLGLWRWRISLPQASWRDWRSLGRLLLWFTWPAWPLAVWTLWRWRRQLGSRHVVLPLWFTAVAVATTLTTQSSDRSLLLGLPALAALAAFALPTLRRSVAALIDWFTLLFFSGCAIIIWVIWIAMQTGFPRQPAANVAKLAPGFVPSFSIIAFAIALAATLAWAWLVRWRAGRNRAAIWKSLVLPAGGAALSWLLLMTLWMPLLDFARSYKTQVAQLVIQMDAPGCAQVHGLSHPQISALEFHGRLILKYSGTLATCPWLIADGDALDSLASSVDMKKWHLKSRVRRMNDENDDILLYRKVGK
ncbi:MAG: hypothetical protein EOO28_22160 [Comamonadaceae bacterium]|nr:MAG: hypothetical protein EOO28_22160 [Comamonadaceae bacterium]